MSKEKRDIPVRLLQQVRKDKDDPELDRAVILLQASSLREWLKQLEEFPHRPIQLPIKAPKLNLDIVIELADLEKVPTNALFYTKATADTKMVNAGLTLL